MNWLMKLLGGWLPIGTKPFPEWAGKIIWVVGIYLALNLAINHFFPQKQQVINVGSGGVVQQGETRDMAGFGCNIFRLYIKAGLKAK